MAIVIRQAERAEAKMVPVSQIIVKDRYRADMGDLESLAASIRTQGLLQPIGLTERNELVFGERRLRACRDILGWSELPARIVNVTSIIEAERDENEVRKDFTPSERVAIAEAVKAELGNRQGQRTDKGLVQNVAQVQPGTKTRQITAKKAGFGNAETYRQAKAVTETGVPELVEKMDAGEVSISAAAVIAKQPAEKQVEIISPKDQKKLDAAVRELRKQKEINDAVKALPKADPLPDDEREALADAVGTYEDRQIVGKVFTVLETIAELPEPAEVAERVPFGLEYAIREELPRMQAVSKWFDGFLAAWKAKENTHDAA